jgi:polyisoprenoid-binding protein YceI
MFRRPVVAAALVFACVPLYATTYTLEPNHCEGIVRWSHLGFSNPTAQFTQVQGTLEFDPAHPTQASVTATIPLAHLTSGVADLDDGFHSSDFFDIAQFPVATFKSTRVEQGRMANELIVTGDFTVHGMTHSITLDAITNKVGINPRIKLPAVGFDATTTLKRSDFKLDRYFPQVSDAVSLSITCQADEAKGYAKVLQAEAAEDAAQAQAAKAAGKQ